MREVLCKIAYVVSAINHNASMIISAAFFSNSIDYTRHSITILSIKSAANYLQFLNAIIVNLNSPTIIITIGYRNTVYPIGNFRSSATPNVKISISSSCYTCLKLQYIIQFGNR